MMERETRKHDIQVHVWITVPGMKFPQIQSGNSQSPLSFLGFVGALVLFHLNTLFEAAVSMQQHAAGFLHTHTLVLLYSAQCHFTALRFHSLYLC